MLNWQLFIVYGGEGYLGGSDGIGDGIFGVGCTHEYGLVHARGEVDAVVQHGMEEFGKGGGVAGGRGGVIGHGLAGVFYEEEADHGADAIDGYGNIGFLRGG